MVSLRSLATSLAIFSLACTGHASAAATPFIIGKEQSVSYALNTTARVPAQQTIAVAGAKFLTIHFSQFSLAPGDVVSLSDATGNVVAEYSGLGRGDLGDKGGFYAVQIFGSSVTLQYKPSPLTAAAGNFGFAVDKVVRSSSTGSVSSICGDSQLEPAKCFQSDSRIPLAYSKSKAVARLTFGTKTCTGWLVSGQGHLLTNFHCIASQFEASQTQYEFEAESPTCDDQCLTSGSCRGVFGATTAKFLGGDEALDYALVKLDATVNLSKYGFLKLRVAGPVDQEPIYIPQHPRGRAKEVTATVDGGDVARATVGVSDFCGSYRVKYVADTEGGSSGSPILAAKDNAVIGLHSCGAPTTGACQNSALDVRTLIYELKRKNILPTDSLDDPNTEVADGPWLPPKPTPAPTGPPTPAPTLDICPGFKSKNTCEVFTQGKCMWINNSTCVKKTTTST